MAVNALPLNYCRKYSLLTTVARCTVIGLHVYCGTISFLAFHKRVTVKNYSATFLSYFYNRMHPHAFRCQLSAEKLTALPVASRISEKDRKRENGLGGI